MAKLNQLIAVAEGKKSNAQSVMTKAYHLFEKNTLFDGLIRKYEPINEEGERLPDQGQVVQQKVSDLIKDSIKSLNNLFDVVCDQDLTNCLAMANIVIDGNVIAKDVPAVTLIFFEKRLEEIKNLIDKVPTLDVSENWKFDTSKDLYVSDLTKTHRSVKEPKVIVKYEATEHHPAQTELYQQDKVVGYWNQTKMSGAWPVTYKKAMLERIQKLKEAVIKAREEANSVEVQRNNGTAKNVLKYIFDDLVA